MSKNYLNQLGAWVADRQATQQEKNLSAFLAVRDDVAAALNAGYSVKTIWAHMYESKRITFKYDAFLGYVQRHLRQPGAQLMNIGKDNAPEKSARSEPIVSPAPKLPGFVLTTNPKKEDLF